MTLLKSGYGLVAGFCLLTGCSLFAVDETPDATVPVGQDGALISDTVVVIDDFHFREAACAELIPADFANKPRPDTGRDAYLIVNATACWKAKVAVLDPRGAVVDSFEQAFGIFGQRDGDKERGRVGYLVWQPRESAGGGQAPSVATLEPGTYLWRIRFDFGLGRSLALRALVAWPQVR